MHQEIIQALQWRYATKIFDPGKHVSAENLQTILEAGRLAPSSFGIEPWKFIVVENSDMRVKLRAVAYDQPKVTDASHLIVIARRTDARTQIATELVERTAKIQNKMVTDLQGLKHAVEGSIGARDDQALDAWIRSQVYIPLGIMVEAAALLDVDSCPMEGFDPAGVDALLGLKEKQLTATVMLTIGYRGQDPMASLSKVRRAFPDVVEFIR